MLEVFYVNKHMNYARITCSGFTYTNTPTMTLHVKRAFLHRCCGGPILLGKRLQQAYVKTLKTAFR